MFEYGNDGPSVILVAVDGSETSLRAGAYAGGLARRQGARLVVLFVHTIGGMAAARAEAVQAMRASNVEEAARLEAMIHAESERIGVKVSFIERSGNPYVEIVRLADELRADAVIVGASTQAGHRLVGSLAVHLVRAARWPITVVP